MTAKIEKSIPYKIYLSEEEMPKAWYNLAQRYEGETRAAAESRNRQTDDSRRAFRGIL